MIGLLKNNFYGAIGSAILFLIVFIAAGAVLLITGNPVLLYILTMVSATAFAFNAVAGFRKEASSKWSNYELTTPIRRKDIVKSRYVSHMSWMAFGILLAAVFVVLTALLHGSRCFYTVERDPLVLFCLSVGIALLLGVIYYPAIYFFGADKSEVIMIISLLGSVGISYAIIWLLNAINGFRLLTDPEFYFLMAVFMGIVVLLFVLSYFLTVFVFRKKEY